MNFEFSLAGFLQKLGGTVVPVVEDLLGVFLDDIVHFQAALPQAAKNGSPAGHSGRCRIAPGRQSRWCPGPGAVSGGDPVLMPTAGPFAVCCWQKNDLSMGEAIFCVLTAKPGNHFPSAASISARSFLTLTSFTTQVNTCMASCRSSQAGKEGAMRMLLSWGSLP